MISLHQHARRILSHSSKARLFCSCSNTNRTIWASNQTLQSQIETALNHKAKISTVLEQWRQQGNKLNPSQVRGIFEKLRDSNRFPQALEVSQWMAERKICSLVPEDYKARFDLVESVLGLEEAEKFLERVPENLRGESMYTALLKSYEKSGKRSIDRAEAAFKKMRELGFLLKPSPYSSMTSLYSSTGNRGKVDEILQEMKDNNVKLDSLTVNNVLRVYAAESDVASMEKLLEDWEEVAVLQLRTYLDMAKAYLRVGNKREAREMLLRAEDLKESSSYEEIMRLYGEAGKSSEDVYRVWNLYKKTRKQDNDGFLALIGSLLNLDDINGAGEMYYREYECSGVEFDVRIPTMLVSGFRKEGMVKQADNLMNKTLRNKRLADKAITPLLQEWGKPSELRILIKNLQDSNQFSKALEASSWLCDQKVINLFPEDYADRLDLTEKVLGLKEANKFFERSIPEKMKGYTVYSTLLNTYTRCYNQNVNEAEAIFEKMGELGFLTKLSPFKSMISLYSVLGKRIEIENLLRKMEEKNIELDSVTMNNVLRVNAYVSDVDLMDKHKSQWADKLKLEVETMDAMATAYEKAGSILKAIEMTTSTQEVYRLRKKIGEMGNEEYLRVIRSLLKLGDVQGAQEMYEEWEQSKGGAEFDARIPGLLISRYCEDEGDEMKVRQLLNSIRLKLNEKVIKLFMKDMALAVLIYPTMCNDTF
ncbi:unnamed protein product [Eruca vesicaria subsp. sativa]|uniref:Pentatricopeptide repeat-containing protein n=1 Tax=Eruca vesicaria subsp. sativa TaxID=29727 RepID=A0ABC8JLQ3_ERUVS|nr:unnamed protein product [Eruca vesicaria subsp. sativa]